MIEKTERFLVFFLLVLLPAQLGKHFWPDWSLVNGIRVDYLSPTIYLTDLLVMALVLVTPPYPPLNLRGGIKGGVTRVVLGSTIALNIFVSVSPLNTLVKWLRVYEYYWLYRYLVRVQGIGFRVQRLLELAIVWTTAVAIAQLLLQRSVGGWLYWLGERSFNLSTPGIAKVFVPYLGLVLRPYSVFPHPNALAGWLLVAGLIVGGWSWVVSWVGVLVSFSRSAIILLPLAFWRQSKILTLLILATLYLLLANLGNPTSLAERVVLNRQAITTIKQFPWFGVGLGNFVYAVPTVRQPAHNIYLLLASEVGLPAFAALSFIVIRSLSHSLKTENWKLKIAVLSVLLTGLVDHYWLTIHQNILLLVVLLAVVKLQSMTTNDYQ